MDFVQWTVVAVALVVIGFVGAVFYHAATSPTFELYKDEWNCTASHHAVHLQPAGKVIVPITQSVCDKYERK